MNVPAQLRTPWALLWERCDPARWLLSAYSAHPHANPHTPMHPRTHATPPTPTHKHTHTQTHTHTHKHTAAPEIYQEGRASTASDIFSFGVLMWWVAGL